MSSVKIHDLQQGQQEIQDLKDNECQSIVGGGMGGEPLPPESPSDTNGAAFCQIFPDHPVCTVLQPDLPDFQ